MKTLINFILDESGSMQDIKESTISGFNEYVGSLKRQKKQKYLFTLTKFDSTGIRIPYIARDIKKVPKLNSDTYQPGQNTPLYDIVTTIANMVYGYNGSDPKKPKYKKLGVKAAVMMLKECIEVYG